MPEGRAVSPWPLHLDAWPEWPRKKPTRKSTYTVPDRYGSPLWLAVRAHLPVSWFGGLNNTSSVRSPVRIFGLARDPTGVVHARNMSAVGASAHPDGRASYGPYRVELGPFCGHPSIRLRPIDFVYNLRVTCPRCEATIDAMITKTTGWKRKGRSIDNEGLPWHEVP